MTFGLFEMYSVELFFWQPGEYPKSLVDDEGQTAVCSERVLPDFVHSPALSHGIPCSKSFDKAVRETKETGITPWQKWSTGNNKESLFHPTRSHLRRKTTDNHPMLDQKKKTKFGKLLY